MTTPKDVKQSGTWFGHHGKPNEAYIGCNVFAEFNGDLIWLRTQNGYNQMYIDHGSISILAGALQEWKKKQK